MQVVLPTYEQPNGGQVQPPESVRLPLPEAPPLAGATGGPAVAGPSGGAALSGRAPVSPALACSSSRKARIMLPRYRHARITQVIVLVNGRRAQALRGHSLRAVIVQVGADPSGETVTLRLRVRKGSRSSTRLVRRSYRTCAWRRM